MTNKKISALTSATTPLAGTETLPIVQSGATTQVSVANLTAGRAVSAASLTLTTSPLPVASGGTGVTSFTAGQVLYGSFSQSASFFTNGTSLGLGTSTLTGAFGTSLIVNCATGSTTGTLYRINGSDVGGFYADGSTTNIFSNANPINVSVGSFTTKFDTSGNIVPLTAAKGINFTANTPASGMTSQLLNWYEEGSFTTTWTNLTGTPSNTTLYYTRIGRLVFFTYPAGANVITGTANSTRFSLPFTPAKPAVGAMITDAVGSAGNTLIWTGTVVYPATFSASGLIFSGSYHV